MVSYSGVPGTSVILGKPEAMAWCTARRATRMLGIVSEGKLF